MDLLARFAAGDREAFEDLFRREQAAVFRWIVRIVRNRATAEDLTIETFWRVYRSRGRFDARRGFDGWVRRIATNVALDHLRVARRETELPDQLEAKPEANPAERREVNRAIRMAFATLPARLRIAATLALIEEEPYSEIADALGISVTAVKSRVFRALRLLRHELEPWSIARNEPPEREGTKT
ncbi:MAG TPA: sigma-70 family RNA polymerase sigma factor [Vicinamibacterales bacterium]|jgi:RNA polymerase sigma-70 factor (ECF subfamily)|nr:sigma-70 family RNA polymerase sigma factor [Vicinamibacterales bacterium]